MRGEGGRRRGERRKKRNVSEASSSYQPTASKESLREMAEVPSKPPSGFLGTAW